DSLTSYFWGIFADPVEIGPMSERDVDALLEPLERTGGKLDTVTRKEFDRQTGGVPLLAVCLAARLLSKMEEGGTIDKATVAHEAEGLATGSDHVANLWADIPGPAQAVLVDAIAR